ncbi:hypothetical protein ACF0H5_024208 [Mactra antiquata]
MLGLFTKRFYKSTVFPKNVSEGKYTSKLTQEGDALGICLAAVFLSVAGQVLIIVFFSLIDHQDLSVYSL